MDWALMEKRIRPRKICHMLLTIWELHSPEGTQPIKHEANRNGKVAFPYTPSEGFCANPDKICVCNPRAMCHGTRGCLCPRTLRAELNQGETSPQHRQLFCGNNKTKGSAGTGCPLNWRSGGCCFQQSTCVFISVSFACVCLSFLISRRPDPDYTYTRVLLNWSRRWPILLTLQTIYQHLSFSPETEDTYQAHQRVKGGSAAGVVRRGDNNSSSLSLPAPLWDGMGWGWAWPGKSCWFASSHRLPSSPASVQSQCRSHDITRHKCTQIAQEPSAAQEPPWV